MENGLDIVGAALMAVVTFPVSFFIARACLRGVLRVLAGNSPAELTR